MTATRTSWKSQAMSESRASLPYARTFDATEHARACEGVVPEQMEDKWFVFYEAPWLWFHRSFTGIAIYGVKLRVDGEGSVVEEAIANRAPEEYRETDIEHDVALLSFMVEHVLLGRDVPFPVRAEFPAEKVPRLIDHVVGRTKS